MATPVGVTFHVSWSTVMSTALSSMFLIIISSFLVLSLKSSQVLRDGREARRVFVLSHQTVGHESARNAPSIEPGSPLPHVPPSGQVVGGC